jgi:hypothetical protein
MLMDGKRSAEKMPRYLICLEAAHPHAAPTAIPIARPIGLVPNKVVPRTTPRPTPIPYLKPSFVAVMGRPHFRLVISAVLARLAPA